MLIKLYLMGLCFSERLKLADINLLFALTIIFSYFQSMSLINVKNIMLCDIICSYSSLRREYDDLDKKADEARNEVLTLKLKINEGNSKLSKLRHDVECKTFFFLEKLPFIS